MLIGEYDISEKRTLTIRKDDKRLDVEVPFGFNVTEEWLDSQFENPEMAKCLNWLEKTGFVQGDNGRWNLYSEPGKTHHVKLPQYFMDEFYSRMRVSFGVVEAKSFYFPRPNRIYSTMEDFPKFLPKKCTIDMNNTVHNYKRMSWIDYTSVQVLKHFVENECKGDINELYYHECCVRYFEHKSILAAREGQKTVFKSPGISVNGGIPKLSEEEEDERKWVEKCRKFYNIFEMEEEIFNMNEKFVNMKRSFEGIGKFQL